MPEPKKILIIDDDPDFLDWITAGLSTDGYALLTATTAVRGLALARTELPDVVIADIRLPDGDGFELCRTLKSEPATAAIPVLLVTGLVRQVESKEKGYRLGADDFLVKPFGYDQLRLRVAHLLGRRGTPPA